MSNKEIANHFSQLAKLMELHGDNNFKIRSYSNAYLTLRKLADPVADMDDDTLGAIKGIGSSIQSKIKQILQSGKMDLLEDYKAKTPKGIQEMLKIKGFGPKKILVIWKELEIESVGELLYACNENRLIELSGFGPKTQAELKQKLEYHLDSKGKYLLGHIWDELEFIIQGLRSKNPERQFSYAGDVRSKNQILEKIIILCDSTDIALSLEGLDLVHEEDEKYRWKEFLPLEIKVVDDLLAKVRALSLPESAVLSTSQLDKWPMECWEQLANASAAMVPENLVRVEQMKGLIHLHTTYSDGLHTLVEMAEAAKEKGFEYMGVTDHSRSAFYANGLKEERLLAQFAEIDEVNKKMDEFHIFKSIESDILNDGSLDYPEEILKEFDFVIASVHSNLRMDSSKATARLIQAIENPYTKILGHPTGRLLLSRKGYEIDHSKIIDACAKNAVAIELNANPYRLDMDYTWIPEAQEKGVMISINPDAHSIGGIDDILFGVFAARKGLLMASNCLNSKGITEFRDWTGK